MILKLNEPNYPSLLKNIPDPPQLINYAGVVTNNTFENCIALVGSRNMTPYGNNVVSRFVSDLSKYECTLVSGLTRGVDNAVHTACLKYKVKTIAVLPCGLSYVLNRESAKLVTDITHNQGVVISEYPEEFEPKKWSFIKRNRVIAGISRAVVVIEAALKSGSLITANFAHSYKREVFVVPGNIFSPYSEGIYHLLSLFARPAVSGTSVAKLLDLTLKSHSSDKDPTVENSLFNKICHTLRTHPMDAYTLSARTKINTDVISNALIELTFQGKISFNEGLYYVNEG